MNQGEPEVLIMKLTGKLKTQVDHAPTKEEKREAIKQAGMFLTDDELDQVAGGGDPNRSCSCRRPSPDPFYPGRRCSVCGGWIP